MPALRRLAMGFGAFAAAVLALAAPSARADQYPLPGSAALTSQHFQIHFDPDYRNADYLPSARANDVLGFAERAYSTYVGLGYSAPLDDGDGNGLIELYVEDFGPMGEPILHYAGFDTPTTPGATTSAGDIHMDVRNGILLDPADPTAGIDAHAIGHEVFNLFQWRIFHGADGWLEESSAEWAAFHLAGTHNPDQNSLGEADRSIDCIGGQCGYALDDVPGYNAFYDRNANTGWSFFEYLSEMYGDDVVKQIWTQAAADGPGIPSTQPVNEVLVGKGSSLTEAFSGWIAARLNGGFIIPGAQGLLPFTFATVKTGLLAAPLPTTYAAVGHLAARYVELRPSDGTSNSACYEATLNLNVAIPSGVTSAPYVFINFPGYSPQPLSVSGSTASISLPWSTCAGTPSAYLSLPNATSDPSVNGNEFVVTGSLDIDPNAKPSAAAPPAGSKMPGMVFSVPTSDDPPSIDVFGPELIQLGAGQRVLRLIVASDGDGSLQASLAGRSLGSATLRAGNNDVRFTLSASALSTLRRTASTSGLLTLTPLSPEGDAGDAVKRRVAMAPAPKPKPKVKPKVKAKAKTVAKAKAKSTTHK